VTGTCLSHGFVCANSEVVPHAQRCDGVEDCADGTDEFMCDHGDKTPLALRTVAKREHFAQAACVRCTCLVNTIDVRYLTAWYDFAIHAPVDHTGLMSGFGTYAGKQCAPRCTYRILMAFYKKEGVCRGWLCCGRQRECLQCMPNGVNQCLVSTGGTSANTAGFIKRCYEV
jgi:hypothetical protein